MWLREGNRLTNRWWREPLLLAAGYLAIDKKKRAMRFIENILLNTETSAQVELDTQLASYELAIEACEEWFFDELDYYKTITNKTVSLLIEHGTLRQQELAYRAAGHVGDTRAGVGTVSNLPDILWSKPINPGIFLMGGTEGWGGGQEFECQLIDEAYCISLYPVTVEQFQLFVIAGGYTEKKFWTEKGWQWREEYSISRPEIFSDTEQRSNYPQIGISWFEAVAYCNWLSEQLGQDIRLSTEYEWERAARHLDGRLYTWGNKFNGLKCNSLGTGIKTILPVGLFAEGVAECGAYDMNGNIQEWCSTKWLSDYKNYELLVDDHIEGEYDRVLRGGHFGSDEIGVMSVFRENSGPRERSKRIGFRVVTEFVDKEQS